MDTHSKALDMMFNDLDELEKKKMFPHQEPDGDEGMSVTITVSPKGTESPEEEAAEESQEMQGMNRGGMAYNKGGLIEESDIFNTHGNPDPEYKLGEKGFNKGGMIEKPENDRDVSLPPFLRKKKK